MARAAPGNDNTGKDIHENYDITGALNTFENMLYIVEIFRTATVFLLLLLVLTTLKEQEKNNNLL